MSTLLRTISFISLFNLSGEYEPNDEECEWSSDEEDEDELTEEMKKAKLENEKKSNDPAVQNVKGVPEFWLTIFKNVDMLQDMISIHEEEVRQRDPTQEIPLPQGQRPRAEDWLRPNSMPRGPSTGSTGSTQNLKHIKI